MPHCFQSHPPKDSTGRSRPRIRRNSVLASAFLLSSLLLGNTLVQAQTDSPNTPSVVPPPKNVDPPPVTPQKNITGPGPALPDPLFVKPVATGEYVLEFNRSPVVGNSFRLRGIYDEARVRFTRPRNWKTQTVKLSLRYRHSRALYATRSNLTVLLNGASIGSVPMTNREDRLGTATFTVPASVIQDYNEVVIAALQNNSPTCTQDHLDPSLWSEILPDSKIVFKFQPQPIPLDFNRYPYPVFDNLNLEPNLITHLLPETADESWLTATARFQTALGRYAQYRPMETRLLERVNQLKPNERLVVIGTPSNQPAIANLKLPLPLKDGQFLDAQKKPIPPDTGILILTTPPDQKNVVLVATGNSPEAVAKAVQFLVQARDRQLGVGRLLLVKQIEDVPSPSKREWPGYLPSQNSFQLKDLKAFDNTPLKDVTVRGAEAPAVEFDFKALPDDRFGDGTVVNLRYSYSPQANPLTSLMEVQVDGLPIIGRRLDNEKGAVRETLRVPIRGDQLRPNSKLQVRFQLDPREQRSCNRAIDQQLWGTVHVDTDVTLDRQASAKVPDLRLLQTGYPFTAPQDFAQTALVLPELPNKSDLSLMLQFAERLGRISRSDSVKLTAYRAGKLPTDVRRDRHLVAIGTQSTFPLPDAFKAEGFILKDWFARQRKQSQLTTLPDQQGVLKAIVSPWNKDKVLLALTGQTEQGLDQVRDLFKRDDLFFQLREDTLLISANNTDPQPYDPQAYTLEFLQQATQRQDVTPDGAVSWVRQVNNNWFFPIPGTIGGAVVLYGVLQTFIKRVTTKREKN